MAISTSSSTMVARSASGVSPELQALLRPSSVAVIGASEDPFTYSGAPVANLVEGGFTGRIYPVNLKRPTVQGLTAYPSVLDIPDPVETAIVAVPTSAVLQVLNDCVRKGIRSVTLVSSGFGEGAAGEAGAARAVELRSLIADSGLRVLGPNTAGLVNLLDSYVPRAAHNHLPSNRLRAGGVALVTQSGALANTVFNRAQIHGVGVGLAVATGGQIDIDVWEVCSLALDDERIRVVAMIVETIDAPGLERVAVQAAELDKAVVLLKLGTSDVGREAVMTHSGSLAGDAAVQSAATRRLGVIGVEELDDLWQVAQLVEAWGRPHEPLGKLGVVALSGGEGALIADHCARFGIDLGETSESFGSLIAENFEYAIATNPFDPSGEVIGRPEKVRIALRAFIEKNDFARVLIASPALRDEIAERQYADLEEIVSEPRPPTCLSYWAAGELTEKQGRLLRGTGLPVFPSSLSAIRAMSAYGAVSKGLTISAHRNPSNGQSLAPDADYLEVRAAVSSLGVVFPPAELAQSHDEARAIASKLGFPLVMKANVVSSTHKFANGLIALGVATASEVTQRFEELAKSGSRFGADGVVIEAMRAGQLEVMLGLHRDPEFGEVAVVGSGGTMVESLDDSALGIARYMDAPAWLELVQSTRIGAYIEAQRPTVNREVAALIPALLEWLGRNSKIASLDLNPFVVDLDTGSITCVDCRVA